MNPWHFFQVRVSILSQSVCLLWPLSENEPQSIIAQMQSLGLCKGLLWKSHKTHPLPQRCCSKPGVAGPHHWDHVAKFRFRLLWMQLLLTRPLILCVAGTRILKGGDETTERNWPMNGSGSCRLRAPTRSQGSFKECQSVTFSKCLFLNFPSNLFECFRPCLCVEQHCVQYWVTWMRGQH